MLVWMNKRKDENNLGVLPSKLDEMEYQLDPKNRDDMVKKRNNFAFADFKKSKKAFKNRKDLDNSTFHTTKL
ncbi:MAG: hypothetical protein ACO28Y_07580, partial [Bacteroidia bacterium]